MNILNTITAVAGVLIVILSGLLDVNDTVMGIMVLGGICVVLLSLAASLSGASLDETVRDGLAEIDAARERINS